MRLATIDIGSNAARLLIVDVVVNKQKVAEFYKVNFLRIPLRLGFEVFDTGVISEEKCEKIIIAFDAFKKIMAFYDVKLIKACATSAMRDAKNGSEVIEKIKNKTKIPIEIISGDKEAMLIYENHVAENMDKVHSYLYTDVGGGSTQLTFFSEGILVYRISHNLGTIRLLKNQVDQKKWDDLKAELKTHIKSPLPIVAIGAGGNINKIFSLSKKKEGKPLTLDNLKNYYKKLANLSIEDRMRRYKLREERADVIVPALEIYINIMRWTGINEIFVPQIGLINGLANSFYQEIINLGMK